MSGKSWLSSAELSCCLDPGWVWMVWLYQSLAETRDQTDLGRLPSGKGRRTRGQQHVQQWASLS